MAGVDRVPLEDQDPIGHVAMMLPRGPLAPLLGNGSERLLATEITVRAHAATGGALCVNTWCFVRQNSSGRHKRARLATAGGRFDGGSERPLESPTGAVLVGPATRPTGRTDPVDGHGVRAVPDCERST
jgi:hypothetical protein